jgi:peptidoglycan hydrolase-like protein with peptidoglycan-binding domain
MIEPQTARWWDKASSMHDAWVQRFGTAPSMSALVMVLAHGEHETRLGDSWPGEHNVGAVQERTLNLAEKSALLKAGIRAGFKNVDAAKSALFAAGLRHEGLHCDSSPVNGPYFVFFRVFDSDVDGDKFFLGVVTRHKQLLDRGCTEYEYADSLYRAHYYEGFHKPRSTYEQSAPNAKWREVDSTTQAGGPRRLGAYLNVAGYAGALSKLTPTIRRALSDWTPGITITAPPTAHDGLDTVMGRQSALNHVGSVPQLDVDGVAGPLTIRSTKYFQLAAGLPQSGEWDIATMEAMRAAIRMIEDAPTDPEMWA